MFKFRFSLMKLYVVRLELRFVSGFTQGTDSVECCSLRKPGRTCLFNSLDDVIATGERPCFASAISPEGETRNLKYFIHFLLWNLTTPVAHSVFFFSFVYSFPLSPEIHKPGRKFLCTVAVFPERRGGLLMTD